MSRKKPPSRRLPVLDSGQGRARPAPPKGRADAPRKRATRRRWRRLSNLGLAWRWLWLRIKRVMAAAAILAVIAFAWLWLTLPPIEQLARVTKVPSILVKTEGGEVIGSYGDVYGEYLPYAELPRALVDAVIATEDRNFYHHFGIDPLGITRAMVANIRAGRLVQGGSTITQQVAKNVFLTPERTLGRKLREVLLAFKLESRFTKESILTIYLNRVYLGAGTYGVDAAARRYFGKSAKDLTLAEAAVITGLLKAPSKYAPTGNPKLARKRAEQVLINMEDAGYLDEKQLAKGKTELQNLLGKRVEEAQSSRYFSDWVVDQLPDFIGSVESDIIVITTLNPRMQQQAEKALSAVMDKRAADARAAQGALVAMSPDGAVRAMIGGRDYGESQYNRTTQAKRQPGSAFKLFVYLAALEAGYGPDSIVEDKPVKIGKWKPQNYRGGYLGDITLREAVAQSINTVAVQVSESVGRSNVINMARRLGVTSELKPDPSIALGSNELTLLELTGAYAHLAANGASATPYGILEIRTSDGRALYRKREEGRAQVLHADIVGMMNDMLMGVVRGGTGRAANIGRDVAGKTGTTSDYKDAWFIGYTPDLVTGVWVGNDDPKPMKKVTGGTLPASIWHDFMGTALAGLNPTPLPVARSGGWLGGLFGQAPRREPSQAELRRQNEGDFELGPSFWDKLSTSGEVEYEYPEQRH